MVARRTDLSSYPQYFCRATPVSSTGKLRTHASGLPGLHPQHLSAQRPYINIAAFIFRRTWASFPNFGNHAA